jgi:hypothetical protein
VTESGNCHPESGNRNPDSGNNNPGKGNDRQGEEPVQMDINMVFTIPAEFCAPMEDVAELALGAEHAMFEKPENPGAHMKHLFIRRHLDGTPIGHILVDGDASINILSLSLFKKLSHIEGDLKHINLSLSGFAGDPTEAKGIIYKEVTVESKTVPTSFFMVDVKGRLSHPGSRKQNRILHTCAQDVQITRTTNNMVNRYNISLNYKLESLQNDPWVQKKYYRVARKSKRRCVFHRHNRRRGRPNLYLLAPAGTLGWTPVFCST